MHLPPPPTPPFTMFKQRPPAVSSKRVNPEENDVQLVLGAQEVSWRGYLLILATPTRHSKGAPLCRYTGGTRKVPFKLRPKDRKKVSDGY